MGSAQVPTQEPSCRLPSGSHPNSSHTRIALEFSLFHLRLAAINGHRRETRIARLIKKLAFLNQWPEALGGLGPNRAAASSCEKMISAGPLYQVVVLRWAWCPRSSSLAIAARSPVPCLK